MDTDRWTNKTSFMNTLKCKFDNIMILLFIDQIKGSQFDYLLSFKTDRWSTFTDTTRKKPL